MTRTLLPLALLALVGCPPATDKPITDGDTNIGVDDDTGGGETDTTCTTAVLLDDAGSAMITPENGATGVYYRDSIVVSFDGDASSATFTLADSDGVPTTFDTTWGDGNLQASLTTVLAADTMYTLTVDLCGATTTSTFSTSSLGAPLTVAQSDLLGRAYVWRLSDATITTPAFLDFVADSYLTVPLIVAVTSADDTSLDLLGGVGYHENDGSYTQVMSEETWDFPSGDFSEQPYFESYADYITVSYSGIPIPIEQFHLSGTFNADGTAIEEGVGSGYGDSRYMGPLVGRNADDYTAVCDIAAGAGVTCEPCSDGEPYCIYIVAEHITATWEEGLNLVEVNL